MRIVGGRGIKAIMIMVAMTMFCGGNVMADGTGWFGTANSSGSIGQGGTVGGGGCDANSNTYRIDCAGVSWVYYESLQETSNDTIFVPHTNVYGSGETAYISSQCSKHGQGGGFWHFGRNAQGLSQYGQNYFENFNYVNGYDNSSTFTYSTSAGSWGHAATVSYGLYSGPRYEIPYKTKLPLDDVIYENGTPIYRAVRYGTAEDVLKDYQKVYAHEFPEAPLQTSLPDDLYAFCSWDLSEPELYAASNARVGEGTSHLAMTGIKKVETTKTAPTLKAQVGDIVPVVFSHNIYATEKAENVNWNMNRWAVVNGEEKSGFFWDGYYDNYAMENYTAGEYRGTVNVVENLVPQSGDVKYVAKAGGYVTRDNYQSVVLKKEGTYKLCETMNVNGVKLTTACVVIEVTKKPDEPGPGPEPEPEPESEDYCTQWEPSVESGAKVMEASNSNEGWTRTVAAVKNEDAGFSDWAVSNGNSESGFYGNAVFAKPDDVINWKHCYYPGVQFTANTTASRKEGEHNHSNTSNGNAAISSFVRPWDNKYGVTQKNMLPANTFNSGALGAGNVIVQSWEDEYVVQTGTNSKAGKSLTETNTSGSPIYVKIHGDSNHEWHHPYSCPPCDEEGNCNTCDANAPHTHSEPLYKYDLDASTYSDTAMVKVPYNFENKVTVNLSNPNSIVYAGETANVSSADVRVGTRQNNTTKGNYATRVNESEVRLVAYTTNSPGGEAVIKRGYGTDLCGGLPSTHGNCNIVGYAGEGLSGVLNRNENYHDGSTDKRFSQQKYNVYDVPAGEYYCVVAAVYPYMVGGDVDVDATNGHAPWVNNKNEYSWYVSAPSCNQIAKRPSLQVWGNSLYTSGDIMTSVSEKHVVAGYYDFRGSPYGQSGANTTVFGSWVEQAILAPTARIAGLASGASTGGYTSNPAVFGSRSKNGLGGSYEGGFITGGSRADFCIRSPLTIPNAGCKLTEIAGGYSSVSASEPSDKSALIARFTGDDRRGYEYDNTTTELGGTVIEKGRTLVIDISGTFTIKGNITYEEGYTTAVQIPKLIIHAKNINIECGVTRVDAALIAEETVNTCSNGGDINSKIRSTQLKIYGTVIADELVAGRTYGAATGAASEVPAEVVDYDTSFYLWGVPRSDIASSGKILTVYQRDLAPRY